MEIPSSFRAEVRAIITPEWWERELRRILLATVFSFSFIVACMLLKLADSLLAQIVSVLEDLLVNQ